MVAKPSEIAAVVAAIDPDANAAGTLNSDGVDMSLFESAMVIVLNGTMGSSGTLDCSITSGTDNSTFGNTVDSITQLTDAGTDSDKQVVMNVRGEDLAVGDRYIRAELVTATATGDSAVVILGFGPKHGPASDNDLSTVDEITTP